MRFFLRSATLGLSLALAAGAGRADSIQLTTSAAFWSDGSLIDSQDDSATVGTSSASALVPTNLGGGPPPNFGDGFAAASANDQGVSAATASAIFYAHTTSNLLEASATIARTAINAGPDAQAFAFHFSIAGPSLLAHIYDGIEQTEEGVPTLTYEVEVRSGSATLWRSAATLLAWRSDQLGHELSKEGVDLGGTFVTPAHSVLGYVFDAFQGSVDLGTVAAGGSVTVETILRVSVAARGTELGGVASIGDPNDLTGGGFSGTIVPAVAAVPEPAAIALVAAGAPVVALGLVASRRGRRGGRDEARPGPRPTGA